MATKGNEEAQRQQDELEFQDFLKFLKGRGLTSIEASVFIQYHLNYLPQQEIIKELKEIKELLKSDRRKEAEDKFIGLD